MKIIMSLPRLNLSKVLIAVLVLLDLFMCFLLVKKQKEYKQAIYSHRENATLYLHAFNMSIESCATIGTLEFKAELDTLGILDQVKDVIGVGLFLPPHPCDACLDRELEMISHYQQDSDHNIIIVAPSVRKRDLQAFFGIKSQIKILTYNIEKMHYPPLKNQEGLVYFISLKDSIEDVFVTSKYSEEGSLLYLSKYLPQENSHKH